MDFGPHVVFCIEKKKSTPTSSATHVGDHTEHPVKSGQDAAFRTFCQLHFLSDKPQVCLLTP